MNHFDFMLLWTVSCIVIGAGFAMFVAIHIHDRVEAERPAPPACAECTARAEVEELTDLYNQPAYEDD